MVKRVWGIVGIVIMVIGAIDLPRQFQEWKTLLGQHESLARWIIVAVGFVVLILSIWSPWKRDKQPQGPIPPPQPIGPYPGIEITGSSRGKVSGNRVTGSGPGIVGRDNTDVDFTDNEVKE